MGFICSSSEGIQENLRSFYSWKRVFVSKVFFNDRSGAIWKFFNKVIFSFITSFLSFASCKRGHVKISVQPAFSIILSVVDYQYVQVSVPAFSIILSVVVDYRDTPRYVYGGTFFSFYS